MKTIEALRETSWFIYQYTNLSQQESRIEAEEILKFVLGVDKPKLYSNIKTDIAKNIHEQIQNILIQRKNQIPLSYILKKHTFYKYDFYVDENVLIPRTETENAINEILIRGDDVFEEKKRCVFLDAGCGSGCVGISIANERPNWKIILSDLHITSLKIAKKNLELCQHNNIDIICGDWLRPFMEETFDFVFSNPPYVVKNDSRIERSVILHEPHTALFSDQGGLKDIEDIIKLSSKALSPSGVLMLENGIDQSWEVRKLLESYDFTDILIHLDYNGHERFTSSRKK